MYASSDEGDVLLPPSKWAAPFELVQKKGEKPFRCNESGGVKLHWSHLSTSRNTCSVWRALLLRLPPHFALVHMYCPVVKNEHFPTTSAAPIGAGLALAVRYAGVPYVCIYQDFTAEVSVEENYSCWRD